MHHDERYRQTLDQLQRQLHDLQDQARALQEGARSQLPSMGRLRHQVRDQWQSLPDLSALAALLPFGSFGASSRSARDYLPDLHQIQLLPRHLRRHASDYAPSRGTLGTLLLVAAGGAALYAVASLVAERRAVSGRDAPSKALRGREAAGGDWRENTVVGRTVTINRSRAEVYAAWRDFSRFPEFLENIDAVEVIDERRAAWRVAGPAGSHVEFLTTITEDRPGEVIAWQSEEDAAVRNSGRIVFRDAPGGRGTEVDATIAYDAPGGVVGRAVAKLFQREPGIQARRDLKRFKQWMETGEIANSASRPET